MKIPNVKLFQTSCALLYGHNPITVKIFVIVYTTFDPGIRSNVAMQVPKGPALTLQRV